MTRLRNFLFVALLVFSLGLGLYACNKKKINEKKPADDTPRYSIHDPNYEYGQYGNVRKPDAYGNFSFTTEELEAAAKKRELPYYHHQFKDKQGVVRQKPVAHALYIETNDDHPLNALRYEIGDTGVPFFDIVIMFALNVDNVGTTYNPVPDITLNGNNKTLLENAEKWMPQFKEKGVKLLIDVLPNHTGYGYGNLGANDNDLNTILNSIGALFDKYPWIDGLDMDEEYAEYYKNPQRPESSDSWKKFAEGFRNRFPDKLLTAFWYGPSYGVQSVAEGVIDYAWPNYGGAGSPNPSNIKRSNYTYQSFELRRGGISYNRMYTAAKNCLVEGFGFNMLFGPDFKTYNYTEEFSGATRALYNMDIREVFPYVPHPNK